jgi:hypothetical protein
MVEKGFELSGRVAVVPRGAELAVIEEHFGRCLGSPTPLMNLVFDMPKLDATGFRIEL